MKTKKIAAVLLTCIMAIGLTAGCGASNTNQSAVQECMATSLLRNARMEVTIRIFIIMAANTEI